MDQNESMSLFFNFISEKLYFKITETKERRQPDDSITISLDL